MPSFKAKGLVDLDKTILNVLPNMGAGAFFEQVTPPKYINLPTSWADESMKILCGLTCMTIKPLETSPDKSVFNIFIHIGSLESVPA